MLHCVSSLYKPNPPRVSYTLTPTLWSLHYLLLIIVIVIIIVITIIITITMIY